MADFKELPAGAPVTQQVIESQSVSTADPAMFLNPYAQGNGGGQLPPPRNAPGAGDNSRVQPQLIINPYVVNKGLAAK